MPSFAHLSGHQFPVRVRDGLVVVRVMRASGVADLKSTAAPH